MLTSIAEQQFPAVAAWRPSTDVLREHAAYLDQQLAWCADDALAAMRASQIGVGVAADYLNRVLTVDDQRALVGIRHYGGNPRRPFVDLLAWTGGEPPALAAVRDAACATYAAFAPSEMRIARDGPPPFAPPADGLRVTGDIAAVAGTVKAMLSAPPPPGLERVAVAAADVDEAAVFMDRAYRDFRARTPELREQVPASTPEALAACAADGHLLWWTVDGERAGLLALERSVGWLALDGWLIEEEIVAAAWAGRGTAACAQRRAAERLAAEGRDRTVFGTINLANPASRRTAARAGRREIATWWFLAPEDH
jgi:hypothetical protein